MLSMKRKICDAYATPSFTANPTPFGCLRDTTHRRVLRLCLGLCPEEEALLSDFEAFSALCSNASAIAGSGLSEIFAEECRMLLGCDGIPSPEEAASVWETASERLPLWSTGSVLSATGVASCPAFFGGTAPSIPCGAPFVPTFSVRRFVKELMASSEQEGGLDEVEARLAKLLDLHGEGPVMADLRRARFVPTDRYHASLALAKGEEDTVFSYCIVLVAQLLCRRGGSLRLLAGEEGSEACALISYLLSRAWLPDCTVGVSAEISHRDLRAIARLAGASLCGKRKVTLSLEFVLNEWDGSESVLHFLRNVSDFYPVGRISLGGVLTDSSAFALRHTIFERAKKEFMSGKKD